MRRRVAITIDCGERGCRSCAYRGDKEKPSDKGYCHLFKSACPVEHEHETDYWKTLRCEDCLERELGAT